MDFIDNNISKIIECFIFRISNNLEIFLAVQKSLRSVATVSGGGICSSLLELRRASPRIRSGESQPSLFFDATACHKDTRRLNLSSVYALSVQTLRADQVLNNVEPQGSYTVQRDQKISLISKQKLKSLALTCLGVSTLKSHFYQ